MNNMQSLLFTGGTGFLGRNIMPLLKKDYVVTTCGISSDDLIKSNLSKEVPIFSTHYDVVLHAAGKAHVVPQTEAEAKSFYDVNFEGTKNI